MNRGDPRSPRRGGGAAIGPPCARGMWVTGEDGQVQLWPVLRLHFAPASTVRWPSADRTEFLYSGERYRHLPLGSKLSSFRLALDGPVGTVWIEGGCSMGKPPSRNLASELVRVTEAAALAAGRFMGPGDREAADRAAVEAMRLMLASVQMSGESWSSGRGKRTRPLCFIPARE